MNELQKLINSYLKFRESIPPINEKDKNLILTSKDELNRYFDKKYLKAINIINDCLDKINRINVGDGLHYDYVNLIYQDLLYSSFSSSGYSIREPQIDKMSREPQIDKMSKYKVSQLTDRLNALKETIVSKESATDIIDAIEDEFSKLKKQI